MLFIRACFACEYLGGGEKMILRTLLPVEQMLMAQLWFLNGLGVLTEEIISRFSACSLSDRILFPIVACLITYQVTAIVLLCPYHSSLGSCLI